MKHIFLLITSLLTLTLSAQHPAGNLAAKPLYEDPQLGGPTDPVIIYNKQANKWWMFYTSRRAKDTSLHGVTWVHGTRIGIAESSDGATWTYKDTASINYHPTAEYTYWAPCIIEDKGIYHMYLTYVPGVFDNWEHPRSIVHLTSKDMLNWQYVSVLKLNSDRVIDPCVVKLPDGTFRMWYNDEPDHKAIYYADSPDLTNWTDKGKAVGDIPGEGPVVFNWKGKKWMITDNWKGLGVYSSDDWLTWQRQQQMLLDVPGTGKDDGTIGDHADVVLNGDRAFIFYFTHPGHDKRNPAPKGSWLSRRSVIQVAELQYNNGILTCDRNAPVYIQLKH